MPLPIQHLVVLTLVAACLGYVGWQAARTLYGKKSRSRMLQWRLGYQL